MQQHIAALNLGGSVMVDSLPVPPSLGEWTQTHTGELNAILAQVKERANVLSIVLEPCVPLTHTQTQGKGKKQQPKEELIITAMGEEECQKAKALLEIHLKNVEALYRTEKRLEQVHTYTHIYLDTHTVPVYISQ